MASKKRANSLPIKAATRNGRYKFLAVAAIAVLSILALEAAVARFVPRIRVYSEIFRSRKFVADRSDYLPFTLPRNRSFPHRTPEYDVTYRFNSLGYRGAAPTKIAKASGTKRIVICGDSFTFGMGVPEGETYADRLQESMGREVEVINAGFHAACSPDSYYAYMRNEGLALEPEIVVIAAYAENDPEDMRDNIWVETDDRGGPVKVGTLRFYTDYDGNVLYSREEFDKQLPWNFKLPVLRQSHLFVGLTQAINRFLPARFKPWELRLVSNRIPPEEVWKRFGRAAQALDALCEENGIDLIYLVIPASPGRETPRSRSDYERMTSILGENTSRRVIPLRGALDDSAYFYPDIHFNPRGHDQVAGILQRYIADNGLLR